MFAKLSSSLTQAGGDAAAGMPPSSSRTAATLPSDAGVDGGASVVWALKGGRALSQQEALSAAADAYERSGDAFRREGNTNPRHSGTAFANRLSSDNAVGCGA